LFLFYFWFLFLVLVLTTKMKTPPTSEHFFRNFQPKLKKKEEKKQHKPIKKTSLNTKKKNAYI